MLALLLGPAQIAVAAQRAVLRVQPLPPQGETKLYDGSTVWQLQAVPGSGRGDLDLAVVGHAEIPARSLKMTFMLRRNADPALDTTHLVMVQIASPPDSPDGGVREISEVLLKASPLDHGISLRGAKAIVSKGTVLFGLHDLPHDYNHNSQLLSESSWFEIVFVYDDGRRAALTLEKGVQGVRAFDTAFAAWAVANHRPARQKPPVGPIKT